MTGAVLSVMAGSFSLASGCLRLPVICRHLVPVAGERTWLYSHASATRLVRVRIMSFMTETENNDIRRPFGLTLLTGLYLFLFLVSASTYGNPFPFLGHVYTGTTARLLVFADCILCLYLFLGIMKRQLFTWYLLICYNLFEIINTIVNLNLITTAELEKVTGQRLNGEGLFSGNIAAALAILLLTQLVYRYKSHFTNRQKYLF